MSAEFESGFFGNSERAWHGLGTVIPEDVVESARALELAELNWSVEKVPLFVDAWEGEGFETAPIHAIRRMSDGRVFGAVGDYYREVQNEEGFAFIDELLKDSGAKFHTAGALDGGKCVWMLARLPEEIFVADEPVVPFLFFTNRHDGKGAVKVGCTPVRIVCANTLAMAINGAKRTWSARHLSQWDNPEKLAESARQTLGFAEAYFERFVEVGNKLAAKKMTVKQFQQLLDNLIPIPLDESGALRDDRTARNAAEMQDAIKAIYENAPNLANVRGTAWAAYNAVAEYGEWVRPVRATKIGNADEQRFSRALVGDPQGAMADKALALLVA